MKNTTAKKPRAKSTRGPRDGLTAERIRAILSDPKTPKGVSRKLSKLVDDFYAESNAFSDSTPDLFAEQFLDAAAAHKGEPRPETRELYPQIVALAEEYEPEEYKVARRVAEIWEAEHAKGGGGAYFLMERVDRVTEGGTDGLMLASPRAELFTPVFTRAVRDIGYDDEDYVALKGLIVRVEAGASLAAIYEEEKRRDAEQAERRKAEELAAPEPKDDTSDEWRYWKLRHLEADLESGDAERVRSALGEFWRFFDAFRGNAGRVRTYDVRQLLPHLIIAAQEGGRAARKGRRAKK